MASLANVAAALPESRFSSDVHYFSTVSSTNHAARDLGRAGEPDGTVVVADEQTEGRGRRHRRWVSPAGTGLYVSLLLRPEFPAAETGSAVQLVAGIATAETLNEFLPNKPVLRWPNDCFVLDSKIAGVLVEAETTGRGFDFLVCGIGVNVNQEVANFPAALRGRATSMKLQLGHRVSRLDVLATLLDTFDSWETAWREYGMDPIRERWLELSPESVAGSVSVQTETGLIEGVANGLTDAGHLIVGTDDGTHEISVGEVIRLRPL